MGAEGDIAPSLTQHIFLGDLLQETEIYGAWSRCEQLFLYTSYHLNWSGDLVNLSIFLLVIFRFVSACIFLLFRWVINTLGWTVRRFHRKHKLCPKRPQKLEIRGFVWPEKCKWDLRNISGQRWITVTNPASPKLEVSKTGLKPWFMWSTDIHSLLF